MLRDETEVTVRYNEADPLGIVWHGHYVRYFEDGRESFGKKYGLSYLDCYKAGFAVPVVSIHCDYKSPLRYGDKVVIETVFINSPAAKLLFEYKIFGASTKKLVATGSSAQVFVNPKSFDLQLTVPDFYAAWKRKWKIA